MPRWRRIGEIMGTFSEKIAKLFGSKNEPAEPFDIEYDNGYYGTDGVGVEDGDDVRVVLSTETVEEAATLLKRTFTPTAYEDASAIV